MSVSKQHRMADRKAPIMVAVLMSLLVGLAGLSQVMQRPQFESYRTVDVIQLTGCGACFGVAMVGLVIAFLLPRFRNHQQNRTIREAEEDDKT